MKIVKNSEGKEIQVKDNQALCRFGCDTVINVDDGADGAQGHCGMCCPDAERLRAARVKPLHDEAVAKAEEEGKARAERAAKRAAEEEERQARILARAMQINSSAALSVPLVTLPQE